MHRHGEWWATPLEPTCKLAYLEPQGELFARPRRDDLVTLAPLRAEVPGVLEAVPFHPVALFAKESVRVDLSGLLGLQHCLFRRGLVHCRRLLRLLGRRGEILNLLP